MTLCRLAVIARSALVLCDEAIFDARLSGDERVRVLIKLLRGRQMPLELPSGQIERKKQRS